MTVAVLGAGADDRDARPEGGEELGGRRGPAPVVRDLQDVDGSVRGRDRAANEPWVDLLFDVASEQQPVLTEADVQDE